MKRAWIAVLAVPFLFAAAWAGRSTPEINDWLNGKLWFISNGDGDTASYLGADWRLTSVKTIKQHEDLPKDRIAVFVRVDIAGPDLKGPLMFSDCRLQIEDGDGTLWRVGDVLEERGLKSLSYSEELYEDTDPPGCDSVMLVEDDDAREVTVGAAFMLPATAPPPYSVVISTTDSRPWGKRLKLPEPASPAG